MLKTVLKSSCLKIKQEDGMSVASHVEELRRKHQSLSVAVEAAERSPSPDNLSITRMKKEKMRLKEEITRLSH